MKIWIHGITGRMGQELKKEIEAAKGVVFVGGSSHEKPLSKHSSDLQNADVVIDFSSIDGNQALWDIRGSVPALIICTTGLSVAERERWKNHTKQVLYAPNTSYGILMASVLAQTAAKHLSADYDIEILETHHNRKKDAPSGTALFLAENVASATPESHKITTDRQGFRQENEIGVSALRGGGVFGEHEIRFLGQYDEIVISHRAYSRALFAQGALKLSGWLVKQNDMDFYELKDVSF